MHPDGNNMHLARAHRLGRTPQPEIDERDLLSGLGSIVGGIINGVGNIIKHVTGGGGSTKPATTTKHNAATTTKKTNNNQAAAVNTQAAHTTAAGNTKAATTTSPAAPETTHTNTATLGSNSNSAASLSGFSTSVAQATTTIPSSSSSLPVTGGSGDTPSTSGANTASSGGLSKGGLGALITILLLLFFGILFFFGRRYQRRQRENRSTASAWAATNFPKFEEKQPQDDVVSVGDTVVQRPSRGDEQSYVTAADLGHHNVSTPSFPIGMVAHTGHTPSSSVVAAENRQRSAFSEFGRSPPASPNTAGLPSPLTGMPYDLAALPLPYGSDRSPTSDSHSGSGSGSGSGPPSSPNLVAMEALVACSFIPTLPDELSISTGERVRVLAEYDDGWAMCQNAQGDEGMVPLECIQRLSSAPSGLQPAWRHSQRISSISGH